MKKSFLSIFLALTMFAALIPAAHAIPHDWATQNPDGTYSGYCEDQTSIWTLDPYALTLDIAGTGTCWMSDFAGGLFGVPMPNTVPYDPNKPISDHGAYKHLKVITFGEGITTISGFVDLFARSVTTINFPQSLTAIAPDPHSTNLFEEFEKLYSVKIPENVTTIGDAFTECPALTTVHLPHGIQTISNSAFYLSPITDVFYDGTAAEWNARSGSFPSVIKNATLHFNDGTTAQPTAPAHNFYTTTPNSTTFHIPLPTLKFDKKHYLYRVEVHVYDGTTGRCKGYGYIVTRSENTTIANIKLDCQLNIGDKISVLKGYNGWWY